MTIKTPIGIYGGTFDPIHYGHLRPNLELCERYEFDHVRFIPSFSPPHRDQPHTSALQRYEMVAQAIHLESRFVLDDREMKRGGSSYMVDTLKSLRQEFPQHPLCLLLGMDAFLGLDHWYHWQEILTYAHIIVSQRPDTDFYSSTQCSPTMQNLYQTHQADQERIRQSLCGAIRLENVTQLAISATDIRHRVKNNQSIRFLMPEAVINLIKCYDLYT
ncbi:MAG: nicotinate-nucleotide adenylyltransferase [Thiotrichaceae bacterium]|nr:nicotinate-nucleotide adenylyltransferase [Thiotrichaceae bacterium]